MFWLLCLYITLSRCCYCGVVCLVTGCVWYFTFAILVVVIAFICAYCLFTVVGVGTARGCEIWLFAGSFGGEFVTSSCFACLICLAGCWLVGYLFAALTICFGVCYCAIYFTLVFVLFVLVGLSWVGLLVKCLLGFGVVFAIGFCGYFVGLLILLGCFIAVVACYLLLFAMFAFAFLWFWVWFSCCICGFVVFVVLVWFCVFVIDLRLLGICLWICVGCSAFRCF